MKQLKDFAAKDATLTQMKAMAAKFIADMWNRQEPYCLSFLGAPGTGKTMLAKLVAKFFATYMRDSKIDKQTDGEIWRCKGGLAEWGAALDEMLSSGDWTRLSAFRGDFFLALDDIAVEHAKMRELSASKLFDILNARQGRRWTIVTANLSFRQIETTLDPRISSRLIRDRNVCFELPATTPDYADRV